MAERRLVLIGLGLAGLSALYLAWGLRAPYGFILGLRAEKLAALIVVGAAAGAATVLFQAASANRLLTPGIVGFDALFAFVQTALVLIMGGAGYATLPALAQFGAEAAILAGAGTLLFGLLLRRGAEDVLRMILTGVILGVLLRGLAGFAARLLEPSEYAVVQQLSFASFTGIDGTQLAIAATLLVLALIGAQRLAPALDVAGLGRTTARAVGLEHTRIVLAALLLVALMVAISTALVGPITFLGLLAASLAHALLGTGRHRLLLPAASLLGAGVLVAGQTLFERAFGLQSTLAVVVELLGGLLFLALVLRRER
ncbi:iron chelate uptake ABC transporter family permease subunit [Jannaschia sp. 2305UL9-9]|uniref:iron chelate uptake ABC transporter family permease subunit n=1 Tax=Jannaschia sp. 2305UL9-9 TaxID=3121638 RepID=UPI00352764A7